MIDAQPNHLTRTMEAGLQMDLLTIRMRIVETPTIFLVPLPI